MPDDNLDQFYADRDGFIAQTEAANKNTEETNAKIAELKLNTQFENAYRQAGGSGGSEALDLIKQFFGDRMRIENGQPVILDKYGLVEKNKDGEPKTLGEKLAELSKTSAFQHCFSADSSNQADSNLQQPKTYTREEARSGKASIEDIAFGRASVENTSGKPDFVPHTKKVNIDKILRGE